MTDPDDIVLGERLLAQRSLGWKLACSAWVLLVALGFGLLSVGGWAIGAALARSRRMWVVTGVWWTLYMLGVYAMENWTDGTDLGYVVFIAVWVGGVAHAAYLSRGVLRARAVAQARRAGTGLAPEPHTSAPPSSTPHPAAPQQPDLPTIPLPDGVAPQRRDLRD